MTDTGLAEAMMALEAQENWTLDKRRMRDGTVRYCCRIWTENGPIQRWRDTKEEAVCLAVEAALKEKQG